jgi:hypothetical protein
MVVPVIRKKLIPNFNNSIAATTPNLCEVECFDNAQWYKN